MDKAHTGLKTKAHGRVGKFARVKRKEWQDGAGQDVFQLPRDPVVENDQEDEHQRDHHAMSTRWRTQKVDPARGRVGTEAISINQRAEHVCCLERFAKWLSMVQ